MVPTDKIPGIEINIACIILFIEGTIESNRKVLKILKALKTENGPEAGIKDTTTIIKSKRLEGASTITQQVAKNFLLTNEVSLNRKIKEPVNNFQANLFTNYIHTLGSCGCGMTGSCKNSSKLCNCVPSMDD